jgi:hypothetical protein
MNAAEGERMATATIATLALETLRRLHAEWQVTVAQVEFASVRASAAKQQLELALSAESARVGLEGPAHLDLQNGTLTTKGQ